MSPTLSLLCRCVAAWPLAHTNHACCMQTPCHCSLSLAEHLTECWHPAAAFYLCVAAARLRTGTWWCLFGRGCRACCKPGAGACCGRGTAGARCLTCCRRTRGPFLCESGTARCASCCAGRCSRWQARGARHQLGGCDSAWGRSSSRSRNINSRNSRQQWRRYRGISRRGSSRQQGVLQPQLVRAVLRPGCKLSRRNRLQRHRRRGSHSSSQQQGGPLTVAAALRAARRSTARVRAIVRTTVSQG